MEAGTSALALILKTQEPYEGTGAEPVNFRVIGPDGEPVARGDLVVHYRGNVRWMMDWNFIHDGAASCGFDTNEDFWVDVYGARSRSGARLEAGTTLVGPIPAERREVEIRLSAERRIVGYVRDESGAPVPGVRVYAEPVYPFDIRRSHGPQTHSEAFAELDGRFELRWLGDLEYVVKVSAPPDLVCPELPEVRAGARDVVLVLARSPRQRITVLDDRGAPVPGAGLWLLSLQDGAWESFRTGVKTDARGVAELLGLDSDEKYIVRVSPPDDRPSLLDRELEDWEPKDTTVELRSGLFVRGTVRDSDGVPTGKARVFGEERGRRDTREKRTEVAEDGSFEIGPFYPGRVRLLALPPKSSAWGATEQWEEVGAGAEGVELVLHARWKLTVRLHGIEEGERHRLDARLSLDPDESSGVTWWTRRVRWSEGAMIYPDLSVSNRMSLFVVHRESGLFALKRGITRETPVIDLRLELGETLRGRLLLPPDRPPHGVRAMGPGFEVEGDVEKDGTFEIRGVPPGSCTVGAWTKRGDTESTTHAEVESGEPVTIDLRDR
ncbi:MAG: carboxypeptidase-like regulatory domain-containing protein [Planctomycetota bacterium]